MTNVVEIGEFRLKHERKGLFEKGCRHQRLVLDDNGDLVTCEDCQKQVSTYWALRMLVERWALLQAWIERALSRAK